MMARLKNSTSKTNRIFFIFSPIVNDFKKVIILMFLIEIKMVAFSYQCCCAIIHCWNCITPHSGLWNPRRYNNNYRMSRKKVMSFLCHLQLKIECDDSHPFLTTVSNLVILIKTYRISSTLWFYPIKIILQDLVWKLE